MGKEVTLTSVGIDIGTTTTQMVLSRLTLVNVMPGSQVPRIEIAHKSIAFIGQVHFTPFRDRRHVDGAAVQKLIAREYESAGITPADIDTGAVIITGEAAKKENAAEIIHSLAGYAGDFVVATAGPDLESVIAGKGSGAEELSRRLRKCLVNIDIGGGTSNIAVFDRGVCTGVACVNVGGRLFEIDPWTHRLSYIAPPAQIVADLLAKETGEPVLPAGSAEAELAGIQRCLTRMVQVVEKVLFRKPLSGEEQKLLMSCSLPATRLDGIVFSGGVAKYIYQPNQYPWWIHGDVGPLLAGACRENRTFRDLQTYEGTETLHATVLGAGAHTVNVSGSTITVDKAALPLRNLPAVCPGRKPDGTWTWVAAAENYQDALYRTVALVLPPLPDTNFTTIQAVARNLAAEFDRIPGTPKVIVAQEDIAKVLGQSLHKYAPGHELVCLDGIELNSGDFLDIAKPLPHEEAVPVIVKTLIFAGGVGHGDRKGSEEREA